MADFEFKVADHYEHDEYMPNALPLRKMFSTSTPEHTGVNDTRTIRALADAIEQDGKLVTPDDD